MTETTRDDDRQPDGAEKRLLTADDGMRCSTAERDRTAAAISTATGEGRLPLDEAEDRLERAFGARYRHELDALVADLPAPAERNGWSAVASMAWAQVSADVARVLGRDAASRRVRIAVLSVVAVLLTAMLVLAFVHGIVDEGPELPGGRD